MSSRRIAVRRSGVHGKGVFAVAPIKAGERTAGRRADALSRAVRTSGREKNSHAAAVR